MSDSDESGVTYTEVSSPFEDLSDIRSPRADDHEHLELRGMLEDPYVEPYAEDASPTAQLPEHVPESNLKAYPEEDDDEDPEEDLVDYPADRGDEGGDEEGLSKDDEDDDIDIEADKEEEEHPAPADSVVVALPVADRPHLISIPAPVPVPSWFDLEFARLLAMSTPPSSPLSPLSSPPPRIPFTLLPSIISPPSPVLSPAPPPSPIRIPPPLPISALTSSQPLQLPSASCREDRPKVTLPPQNRLGIALGPGYEVEESSSAAAARPARGLTTDYSFVATMDREIRHDPEREVRYGITDSVRRDMDEIYSRLDDEQSERQLLAGLLNMLFRDRRAHAYTHHLMETEARLCREAWVRSMDTSDLACGEVMSLRTTVLGQTIEIKELQAADRRRQIVTSKMLRADHRRFTEVRGLRIADRTGDHTTGTSDSPTGAGDSLTGIGYRTIGTAGTSWRSTADQETTNTTSVTNAQLQAMIDQCVTVALAAHDALRSTNGDDSYNSGTGELALLYRRMFPKESDKIESYIRGLPDMVHESVVVSKPKIMQEAVEIATELMDKKIHTFAECETTSKRKSTTNTNNANNQRGTGSGQKPTCYECGVQGHFKREWPKLKNNNNHDNQGGRVNAPAKVYAIGRAGTDPDSNVMKGMFLLNNRYTSILFDTGADKSFVSTAFSSQINITPSTLDHYYDVELAERRIIRLNLFLGLYVKSPKPPI
nr:hypothetical protein [Tanacetum cinerariifolium]